MIKYNKPEPQLKRGICSRSCSKAASGLPLEFALLRASCYITWRIGRVRTNTMPLDRRKPPDHLGTWSSLNQSRLLIGLRPQNHLGAWSNPNHCHASWSGIYATSHLGTWLTWTIATPIGSLVVSDHGNAIWSAQIKPLFANGFIIAFASHFSLIDISFIYDNFSAISILTFHCRSFAYLW